MGLFFTSTQIFNKELINNKDFIDLFCNKMKEAGYVTCERDEAEKSYVLRFADNCKWVTITSEDYEQGNQTALNDTSRIAKMLNTSCVNTTVIDSDCSVMELYDADGNKADALIMGRADDYFGDSISFPSENAWKHFLSDGNSWEKLCEIVNNSDSYVFVENGLSELAPLIGMDERNITFSFDEASEDEQTVFLNFKIIATTKGKRVTLNTAFNRIFGESLEFLCFEKTKTRHPYYVRIINDEILHVITIKKDSFCKNKFEIFAGVASIYRTLIDFEQDVFYNTTWLVSIRSFMMNDIYFKDITNGEYEYELDNLTSLEQILSIALEHSRMYIFPVLDSIKSLFDIIDFYHIYHGNLLQFFSVDEWNEYNHDDNECLLYYIINDHSDMKSEYDRLIKYEKQLVENGKLNYNIDLDAFESLRQKRVIERDAIFKDKIAYQFFMRQISCNKNSNIERLLRYGLTINREV